MLVLILENQVVEEDSFELELGNITMEYYSGKEGFITKKEDLNIV